MNETGSAMVFEYRWGIANWRQEKLPPSQGLTVWHVMSASDPLPPLVIRYDNSYTAGYTEQRYVLNTVSTSLPAACEQAKQYVFTTDGVDIHLQAR